MPVLLAAYTHIAESARSATGFEGQRGDAFALLGRGVEAVDVVARGVVEEVGFGVGDVVAELPVSGCVFLANLLHRNREVLDLRDRNAQRIEAFVRVCKIIRFRVPTRH